MFLSTSSSKAHSSRDYYVFVLSFSFLLSPDFHENWCIKMSTSLFLEVKQSHFLEWVKLELGC